MTHQLSEVSTRCSPTIAILHLCNGEFIYRKVLMIMTEGLPTEMTPATQRKLKDYLINHELFPV